MIINHPEALQSSFTVCLQPTSTTVPDCGYPTVPFFRAWSEAMTDHFYTTNITEMEAFFANGYTDQGIAGYILPSDTQAPTAVPLFRLYNAQIGDHAYTTNASERDASSGAGYVSEGIAGFVYPYQECGTVPFYRLSDGQSDTFYTTAQVEVDDFIEQLGYRFRNVAAYVNSQ